MKPLEMTIGISPADLAPWNGAEVPVRFIITERSVRVCIPPPFPGLTPEILAQLRVDFSKIKLSLSTQSHDLLWFLLKTPQGMATREEVIDCVWLKKVPSLGGVRKAIYSLNISLKQLNFGYVVQVNRKGIVHLTDSCFVVTQK